VDRLPPWLRREQVTHVEVFPARTGRTAPWPGWVSPSVITAFETAGIVAPWEHQALAATHAWDGRDVVVATGTGSGKSLAYQMPVLTAIVNQPRTRALYLAPTKALAADQLRVIESLSITRVLAAVCDGDTTREQRDWVRQHANVVLSNPDLLHHSLLPQHERWAPFLRNLRYVVVDESHSYRGVFGAHVAHVLRRLRRLTDDRPVFILASATSGEPAASASKLVGRPVIAVARDTAPRGAATFALWEPPLLPGPAEESNVDGQPIRRSALRETGDLLADAVSRGIRTLAFVPSRRGAEVVAAQAKRVLDEASPGLGDQVAAYRAGYLPEERRELERALTTGELTALATTNALELGIDVTGLDAVLLAGYPGRRSAMWQRAGRAGRAGRDALCVLVARDDPLDTYLVHHPEALFHTPVEATVFDPDNPYVLAPHLCTAAAERPLTEADLKLFGAPRSLVDTLVEDGLLRERPTGWYWTHRDRPGIDLRGTGGPPVSVIEAATGRLIGTADAGAAHYALHAGAVYTHQGRTYVVRELDLDDAVAVVVADDPPHSTHARDITDLEVLEVRSRVDAGPVQLFLGDVEVTSQVVSFQRRRLDSGEVLGTWPLDLPPRTLRTVAVWVTLDDTVMSNVEDLPGSLHAAEHAAIGLLPLVASCDRWDIGGLSTARHADTDLPTIFVYDGHPGGAGLAERAFHMAATWLAATRDTVDSCACEHGCPSCVQSPKCGNGNNPLDKHGAVSVLSTILTHLPSADVPSPRPPAEAQPVA
jgi:DEAD/DEAH box helicase domain-containing protein